MSETCTIRCGVAGWSYPDWAGIVYPRGARDCLLHVAPYVDVIEINSTFYRPPEARTAACWAERTADLPDFTFTAKLHRDMTHGGKIESERVRAFRDGLEPLRQAGRLSALLAQFPHSFCDEPDTRRFLQRLADGFRDTAPLAVEIRHASWQAPDALAFLSGLGAAVVHLDYPVARDSFDLAVGPPAGHAYFRLHGRNNRAWFDPRAGRDETYDYLYSDGELRGIAERAARIASMSKTLTLVANNHYQGKEFVNALQLKALLTGRRVRIPPGLAAHYPQLDTVRAPTPEADAAAHNGLPLFRSGA